MQKNTCVVYIITKLELGGAQKVCLTLFNNVSSEKHLISGQNGPLVSQVQGCNNVHLLASMTREVTVVGAWQELKNFFALVRLLRTIKQHYTHVIVHTHSTKAGLLGRWAAFFAGIRLRVHTIHGYGFNDFQPWYIWYIIYFLELITSIITTQFVCVSAHDACTGCRLFPCFTKKHEIIHAAVDWHVFALRQISSKNSQTKFIFGTIACFKKQKNLFDLLQAFACVHNKYPCTCLEIIGDGVLRPALEKWLTHEQLADAVTLHGWQDDVAPIAARWNAFVLTSLWEGLPCSVIEARLLKLPVISYKTGGVPEVIKHGKNGFLHEQKDWQAVAQSMQKLVENPALQQKLGHYHDNLDNFRNETMIRKHQALYKKLIEH